MRQLFLTGACLSLLSLTTPAFAIPVGKIAPGFANDGVEQVYYPYYRHRSYYYRPRAYVYRNYGYGYPVRRSYGYYGGGPYYGGGYGGGYYGGGYGGGYYGGGPTIGFSFGGW